MRGTPDLRELRFNSWTTAHGLAVALPLSSPRFPYRCSGPSPSAKDEDGEHSGRIDPDDESKKDRSLGSGYAEERRVDLERVLRRRIISREVEGHKTDRVPPVRQLDRCAPLDPDVLECTAIHGNLGVCDARTLVLRIPLEENISGGDRALWSKVEEDRRVPVDGDPGGFRGLRPSLGIDRKEFHGVVPICADRKGDPVELPGEAIERKPGRCHPDIVRRGQDDENGSHVPPSAQSQSSALFEFRLGICDRGNGSSRARELRARGLTATRN